MSCLLRIACAGMAARVLDRSGRAATRRHYMGHKGTDLRILRATPANYGLSGCCGIVGPAFIPGHRVRGFGPCVRAIPPRPATPTPTKGTPVNIPPAVKLAALAVACIVVALTAILMLRAWLLSPMPAYVPVHDVTGRIIGYEHTLVESDA